ncbi:hypothetical protein GQ43DRAFT_346843, partial [Delitschia confertaspora ATCC 74209]
YTYSPLVEDNTIRIIELQPSLDPTVALQCSIAVVFIDDLRSDYEAISYTWGAPVFPFDLNCNDGTVFKITSNLHAALCRFRRPKTVRLLWADSVSIHQRDDQEKGRQVGMMAKIFPYARRVLVWLGEGGENEDKAMEML